MKMKSFFTFVSIILFVLNISAQEIELGIIGGLNLNFVSLKSDYNMEGNIETSPNLSYNFGTTLTMKKDRKIGVFSLEYYRISNKYSSNFISTDPFSLPNGICKTSVVINNLRISALFNIKIVGGFFCGGGIAGNFNLDSKLILNKDADNYFGIDFYGDKYKATFIRNFTVSIPIMIGYEFNKFDVVLVFDKGIMNRLEGNNGFINEINNVLSLSFNYRFYKF